MTDEPERRPNEGFDDEYAKTIEKPEDPNFYEVLNKDEWGGLYHSMPKQVKLQYGCINCEWRDAGICRHGFKRGSKENYPKGICHHRMQYLAGFVVGLESYTAHKRVTFSQWMSAMIQMNASRQHLREDHRLKLLQYDLDTLELDCREYAKSTLSHEERLVDVFDKDVRVSELSDNNKIYKKMLNKLNRKKTELHYARTEWLGLIDKMSKQSSNQLDREQPKKVEIDVKQTMSLEDRHRIMAGDDLKIVEGEVIKDDKEI